MDALGEPIFHIRYSSGSTLSRHMVSVHGFSRRQIRYIASSSAFSLKNLSLRIDPKSDSVGYRPTWVEIC